MLVRELLKEIAENCKLDDEILISDNYGCCVEIDYIDREKVHKYCAMPREAITLNIKNRIDLRSPEKMLESEK